MNALRTCSAAAVRAASSERLTGYIANGWAHESERANAPEALTSAIEDVERATHGMRESAREASEALEGLIQALSGRSAKEEDEKGGGHWIEDVPTGALLSSFAMGSSEPLLVEQWLWLCTAVVEMLERECETREKIVKYLRRGEMDVEELSGCAVVWSTQPFLDQRLFDVVCADKGEGSE